MKAKTQRFTSSSIWVLVVLWFLASCGSTTYLTPYLPVTQTVIQNYTSTTTQTITPAPITVTSTATTTQPSIMTTTTAYSTIVLPGTTTTVALPITTTTITLTTVVVAKFEIGVTDSTFQPLTAIVKAGTAVTFVNQGEITHTVVSGTLFSHMIAAESSWTYTFSQPGTYKFSDLENPQIIGTLTVQ